MRDLLGFMLRRVAAAVFTVLAMIALTFAIFWAIPSQPADFVYPGLEQHPSAAQIKKANHLLGIDRPKIVQYGDYVWHVLRGDFGNMWNGAFVTGNQTIVVQPIGPVLFPAIRTTLSIILGGALLVVLLAVPLGAIAGRRIGSISDRTISLVALIGICTQPMVVGLILRTGFGDRLGWLPPTGYCTFGSSAGGTCSGPWPWAEHLILPWLTFALLFLALYTRMIRISVDETLREDFVRTARAKGVGEQRLMSRHVLPNAGLRVLTMVGMEIGTAIGVCIYIEAAFGIQGLGNLAVQTMIGSNAIDLPLVLAVVTTITLIVVIGNLVVDLLYGVIDPRVRTTGRARRTKSLAGGVI
jgi:peptide/nickel transport system permease protein